MRISLFLVLLFCWLTILFVTFIIQFPTTFSIGSMIILLFICAFVGYQVHRKMGSLQVDQKNVIVSTFVLVTLCIIIALSTDSLIIHISIWLIAALQLYMTFSFIFKSFQQKTQMTSVNEEIGQFNDAFSQVSAQRHDYMKHIHVLDYLLDKDGASEASLYMDQLLPNYKRVNKNIKGEQGHIASILLKFQTFACEHDITFGTRLDQPLSQMPLEPYEQIELIGNLLENAMEAAKETEKKDVSLLSSRVSGIYKVEVVNTTNPLPDAIVNHLFTKMHPSKKGTGHGVGTTIIKNLVQKYEGTVDYTYNGKKMNIRIALPLIDRTISKQ